MGLLRELYLRMHLLVLAGVNGGFTVVGIASTFPKEVLLQAGATYVVEDFTKVKIDQSGKQLN